MLALLARVLTVLTVALGLAVMAVSVYAAKVEAQDPEPVQGSPELLPGEPVPLAAWPDAVYLLVSLREPEAPVLRGYHIQNGQVTEAALEVIEGA